MPFSLCWKNARATGPIPVPSWKSARATGPIPVPSCSSTRSGTSSSFLVAIATLSVSRNHKEEPAAPLGVWLMGYSAQCIIHIVCVLVEFDRRQQGGAEERRSDRSRARRSRGASRSSRRGLRGLRSASGGGGRGGRGGGAGGSGSSGDIREGLLQRGSDDEEQEAEGSTGEQRIEDDRIDSIAKQIESANTVFSFLWWSVGFAWIISTFDDTFEDAPILSW
ncbi:unnamed protein product [Closterium sp. NIES-65]|nr:unnamed protein product [Closterium sp. NIES-65]